VIFGRFGRIAACVVAAAGCSAPAPDAPLANVPLAVVNGEPSKPGGIEDAVVLLRTRVAGGDLVCSGTLVAPNLVVTARHCVSYSVDGPFRCTVRGELTDNPDGGGTLGLHLPADQIEFYDSALPRLQPLAHGARIISTLSQSTCVNDLAFVVLDHALALPVLPLRLGSRARASEDVTLVGYGTDEFTDAFDWHVLPRLRKSGLTITAVGPDSVDQVTTLAPRTIQINGPAGCLGDSGAPLRAASTNALLGVYSLLAGAACNDPNARNFFVHLPSFQALIDEAFAAAGAMPILEPVAEPEPEPTDSGMDEAPTLPDAAESEPAATDSSVDEPPPQEPPAGGASGGCEVVMSPRRRGHAPSALGGVLLFALCTAARARRRGARPS
jgi:hypothetical protein